MIRVMVALGIFFGVIANARLDIMEARMGLLDAQKLELEVENKFLARKLAEARGDIIVRLDRQECTTDLAIAGFRMGHYRAAAFRRQGGFESCNRVMENEG